MSKEAIQLLKNARELISDPRRWTQNTLARTKAGFQIGARERNAFCFCAVGVVVHFGRDDVDHTNEALVALKKSLPGSYQTKAIESYNDTHKHKTILRLFDRAIENLERDQS